VQAFRGFESLPARHFIGIAAMSRKEFDASRMRRMKRVAARHGLTILTSEKIKVLGQPGGHAVRDDESFKIVYGDVPKPFSATLDDIEAYLERLEDESS
jgi:predicted PolB exonuclease-like 3'-5' exonuclease